MLLSAKELPTPAKSNTEIVDPSLVQPNTDSEEPILAQLLRESALPTFTT